MNSKIMNGVLVGLTVFAFQATAATKTVVLQNGLNGYNGISDMFWSTSDGGNRDWPMEGSYVAHTSDKLWMNGSG